MGITLTLKDLIIIAIAVCVIILIVQCIRLIGNLIQTVKKTNDILDDSAVISAIAAERTKEVNEAIGDATETVRTFVTTLKGQQSTIAALTTVINFAASMRNILSSGSSNTETSEKSTEKEKNIQA